MVLLWQSSAFLLRLGFFPQHAGFGYLACAISSIAANPMNYYGHGSDIFRNFWNPNTVSAALRLRDVCDIQLQSHGNLKRTKSFTPCSSPTETSFPLPSASSFSVQRSKSDPRKYENQKRIIQYLPYLNPEIVIQSRVFFVLRTDLTTNKTSANVTEAQSSPITILSAEKASFCSTFSAKESFGRSQKQMPNPASARTTYARAFVRAFLKKWTGKA